MSARLQYSELPMAVSELETAVLEGLGRSPKAIPPKFFYDRRGSELFDAICAQPEYYLPAAEREILQTRAAAIATRTGSGCVLIEPGAGNGAKVRLLLEHIRPSVFVPLDISGSYLQASAERLSRDFPWLRVHAARADFSHGLELPAGLPEGRRVAFYPGSSLGNFEPEAAVAFLATVREALGDTGGLLIGIDTKKDAGLLNAAYNDTAGVTAAFNLNLLHRIRRELETDLEPDNFHHHAFYNPEQGRIEMHLVSRVAQEVRVNDSVFPFLAGETIHTESSYKYQPEEFRMLARRAGFQPLDLWLDSRGLFSFHYLEAS